jgi:hypothetical protein
MRGSVSENSQLLRTPVVPHSRLSEPLLALALVTSWPSPAAADSTKEPASTPAPRNAPTAIAPLVAPERVEYGGLLGATYALAPLLALGAGGGLFELTHDDTLAVIGACSMAFLPATVHAAHGNAAHGALSFLALAGITGSSLLVGGFIGGIITTSTCEDESSDSCDFAALPGIVVGGLIGGVTGYASYAIYDSFTNASLIVPRAQRGQAALGLWVRPLPVLRHPNGEASTAWGGALFGATLQL